MRKINAVTKSDKEPTKTDDELSRQFGIKPCRVDLVRFHRVRIGCVVKSPEGAVLKCSLEQNNINSFTLRLEREKCAPIEDSIAEDMIQMIGNTSGAKLRERKRDDRKENVKRTNLKKRKNNGALVPVAKKPKHCECVQMGEVILCKIRGYSEWPCVVTGFENALIDVRFFGDDTTFRTTKECCYEFKDCHDLILSNLKKLKKPTYKKAIEEAELVMGIPREHSILNQVF